MATAHVLLFSYLAALTTSVEAEPLAAVWSSGHFGPDGPWKAVEVQVGGEQTIALYPGAMWSSALLMSDYCTYNQTIDCHATMAGLYNKERSELAKSGSDASIAWQPGPGFMSGLKTAGENLTMWVDNMDISGQFVSNVSIVLVDKTFAEYPDGSWMPLSVGCLGTGVPHDVNHTFTRGDEPSVNASLIPGYLWTTGAIASYSFGMHIGSIDPPMASSLYFGGYDENRVVGNVMTGRGAFHDGIRLKDIGIRVFEGASPWAFESDQGLLAENNGSITSAEGIDVSIDGCSPYLTLPASACDAIASRLPVDHDPNLGLYLWRTDDQQYKQIVRSSSALQFTFASDGVQDATIAVPFRHLNLTLEPPLVLAPRQYFPCFTGGADRYTLGRAFLQDAFLGANWGANISWLAQAPGPNVPDPHIVELDSSDISVQAGIDDWDKTWSGYWEILSEDDVRPPPRASGVPSNNSNSGSTTETKGEDSSLARRTRIGIGVGVSIGAVVLIGAIASVFIRRRLHHRNDEAISAGASGVPPPSATPAATTISQQVWYPSQFHTSNATGPSLSPEPRPPPPTELPGSHP